MKHLMMPFLNWYQGVGISLALDLNMCPSVEVASVYRMQKRNKRDGSLMVCVAYGGMFGCPKYVHLIVVFNLFLSCC